MLPVDFHSHTIFSTCGLHTIVEMLTSAKNKGVKALAITDHGTAQNGHISSPFFDRLKDPVEGVRLLKGQESNIVSDDGDIDFPIKFLKFVDIVLLGLHPNLDATLKKADYTAMLISAMQKNPYVDILTHINDSAYPVDFDAVIAVARQLNMAIEFNNSKVLYSRVPPDSTIELIESCKKMGCRAVISSDAHALHEVGLDDSIRPLLNKVGFPLDRIINETEQRAYDFIEERRQFKMDWLTNHRTKKD